MSSPIFRPDATPSVYGEAIRILGLARIGVASTDTAANIDLTEAGYSELFEMIGRVAHDMLDRIEELERQAKAVSANPAPYNAAPEPA